MEVPILWQILLPMLGLVALVGGFRLAFFAILNRDTDIEVKTPFVTFRIRTRR